VLDKKRVTAPENLDVEVDRFLEEDEPPEFEASPTGEASSSSDHYWARDIERLDELIDQYLSVALSAEQDPDRALRAAYVTLELIEMQPTLSEYYLGGVA
jgi:hypothetical protein